MTELDSTASELLGSTGPFAELVSGFNVREPQLRMAAAVEQAIDAREQLVVEAGTGTGKTYAYLVPVLHSGKRAILSTGTRHLQDQLFHSDLPRVCEALGVQPKLALLKGRSNYLCLHRLQLTLEEGRFARRRQAAEVQAINDWSGRTRTGDVSELSDVPEDAPVWPRVTSTADNCLGSDCPSYRDCFVLKARRRAQEAEVVVVNHHLLSADMALKEEGFGELLPGAEVVVIDEAHQLPETAAQFFGLSLGSRQLQQLARDAKAEHLREAGDMQNLPDSADALDKAAADLRLAFGQGNRRLPWKDIRHKPEVESALADLRSVLEQLRTWLETAAPRGKGLEGCWHRAEQLAHKLARVCAEADGEYVQWLETYTRSFAIHLTPLNVAGIFQQQLARLPATWVFTSATLAVGQDFHHFTGQLGLHEPHTLQLESPFDFQSNSLLYVPPALPEPNSPSYTGAVMDHAEHLIEASGGRAFLLFTSHRALQAAADRLQESEYPVLVQGQMPKRELLRRFRELGNAVLLGTSSFWEGVDVRGEALSLVLIDKLPFAAPGDPVVQARIDRLREAGGNPFMEFQVPAAVITLKQGVGRLIRDAADRGVLVLCDPRLLNKPYGRVFRRSLPPMPLTRELREVEAFFAAGMTDKGEQARA
ncbi:helicase [Thiohalobacter sp. COW1]|uniref:ATP-dependent DNA helicase n=1 Tax=Thiohalobacter sp. COW1 TaxID=2795687 RepID=UPI001938A333|nr:ATP-dependent DNA helicase [Thiohalobacter sp. COW1]BCO30765.1 helicase [Thiohalobacter sp. COW1]